MRCLSGDHNTTSLVETTILHIKDNIHFDFLAPTRDLGDTKFALVMKSRVFMKLILL